MSDDGCLPGLGTIIAVVVSWSNNHDIFWAIVHGLLGWLYIIYIVILGFFK